MILKRAKFSHKNIINLKEIIGENEILKMEKNRLENGC